MSDKQTLCGMKIIKYFNPKCSFSGELEPREEAIIKFCKNVQDHDIDNFYQKIISWFKWLPTWGEMQTALRDIIPKKYEKDLLPENIGDASAIFARNNHVQWDYTPEAMELTDDQIYEIDKHTDSLSMIKRFGVRRCGEVWQWSVRNGKEKYKSKHDRYYNL